MAVTDEHTPVSSSYLKRIPQFWANSLFPEKSAATDSTSIRWRHLLLLIFLPALLLYPTRNFLLLEPDEGRYAEIAREMMVSGSWVVPTLQGEPYLDKPPLFYWLVKISFQLFGVSDATARLVPALAVHLTILALYLIGRRSLGERSALFSALTLCILPGFMGMARLLILDGVLTLTVTLELLCLYEAIRTQKLRLDWWYAAALASGLGILTKGPIALMLVIPPLIAHRWLTGRRRKASVMHLLGYGAVLAAINLPWYWAIYQKQPVFLKYFFWDHNVMRFLQPFDHLQPVWYYVPVFFLSVLPCLFLGRSFMRWLLNESSEGRSQDVGFWLLAGSWAIIFFSISGSKLPTYILPAFPPLALVFGSFLTHSRRCEQRPTQLGGLAFACVLFLAFAVAVPFYAQQRSPLRDPGLMERVCSDPETPIVCFPRNCDSVSFYLNRADLISLRGKQANDLLKKVLEVPRTVVLFTHDHSLGTFEPIMPHDIYLEESISLRKPRREQNIIDRVIGANPWGLCDIAVVKHKRWGPDLSAPHAVQSAQVDPRQVHNHEDHDYRD
ncbi:glycosyltransferase family 39 protein [Telmatocola sphagniphila]|uniref:Glycosyltransferase family 39 protein n=2 Tax=Telmatocola sphagniphila TaxID=1123043 RepID=A0A8E6BAS1_9BACT|nr:glycosyltransferase family 39 protein [Telmatocola sphagniphila]